MKNEYIDPIDKDMMLHKHKLDVNNYKQPIPKWYNVAWDAFRTVENHSKSMIFQFSIDVGTKEYKEYKKIVKTPIDLDEINQKLKQRTYQSLQEFLDDMQLMFDNLRLYRGSNQKIMACCDSVKVRFDKFLDKAVAKRLGDETLQLH